MKVLSLKLKTGIESVAIFQGGIENAFFKLVVSSLALLALAYIFILGNMISNTIERRSFESEARILGAEVRELELAYLSLSNNIDLSLSYSLGFKDVKPVFTTRKALGLKPLGNIKSPENEL